MSPFVSAIPFSMWGIDLVGQFLKPPVKYKDVVMAVDYFSKWVEAAPLRSTTSEAIEEFIWNNIITRYGTLKILVSDNGPQFDSKVINETCAKLGIEHRFAPVYYPQYNGQVEVMNRTIFTGITKNLLESATQWGTQFSVGDLVLRVMEASQPKNKNKLNPKWEGPYRVRKVIGPGTYELEELSGKEIDHTWHGVYLKKYYF
ncbi:hypothetical protein LIER_29104 [Lithospermum erythrorhizon]|uniref:Integrase catalytic domain-containing protein n=1 Tax=Lithospermum erythrorhizon TaxID=34254 RepID=A0AAV3RJM4_LITER